MSFADPLGNSWSILFDSVEVMQPFIRTLVATVAHVACFGDSPGIKVIMGQLPSSSTTSSAVAAADDEGSGVLAAGSAAGVQYKVWELAGEPSDVTSDLIALPPLKAVVQPDITKIK